MKMGKIQGGGGYNREEGEVTLAILFGHASNFIFASLKFADAYHYQVI